MANATIRVSWAGLDPLRRDRLRRWMVTADVVQTHEGSLPATLNLLVHSVARDFRESLDDLPGQAFRITLPDDPDDPYLGPFTLTPP